MGIHISLRDAAGNEVPEWDSLRWAGDRDFWKLACSDNAPVKWTALKYPEDDAGFIPTDFDWWLDAARELPNPDRFVWLVEYVRDHPGSYITAGF